MRSAAAQAWITRKAVLIVVVTNERECVPRLDLRQQSRVYFRMTREIVVETRGEGIAQRAHVLVQARVFLTCQPGDLECVVESVFIQGLLAVQLGSSAQCVYIVFLDAPEVVFGLSVSKPEHGARVCAAKDVRDAVSVTIDRNRAFEFNCMCLTEKQSQEYCGQQSL